MRNFLPVKCYYANDISCVPFFANGKKKLTVNEADAKKLKIFLVIKKMLQIIKESSWFAVMLDMCNI